MTNAKRISIDLRTWISLLAAFVGILFIGTLVTGCGGPVAPEDTGHPDSGMVDTGPRPDTGTPPGATGTDATVTPPDTGTATGMGGEVACMPVPVSSSDWDCNTHMCCTCNIPDPLPQQCTGIEEMCRSAYRVEHGRNMCTVDLADGMTRGPFTYSSWIASATYVCAGSSHGVGFEYWMDDNGFSAINSSRFVYTFGTETVSFQFRCSGSECWANRKLGTMLPYAHISFTADGAEFTFEKFDTSGTRIGDIVDCIRSS